MIVPFVGWDTQVFEDHGVFQLKLTKHPSDNQVGVMIQEVAILFFHQERSAVFQNRTGQGQIAGIQCIVERMQILHAQGHDHSLFRQILYRAQVGRAYPRRAAFDVGQLYPSVVQLAQGLVFFAGYGCDG